MFLYSKWLELPLSTREQIAQKFGIARIRSIHVSDNRVVDDGYNPKDIDICVNIEAIQHFINSTESDYNILWSLFIDIIEGRAEVKPEPTIIILPPEEAEQFNKEYEDRTGKVAPREKVITKKTRKNVKKSK